MNASNPWPQFAKDVEPCLDSKDDCALWESIVNTILNEWADETSAYSGKDCVITEIGRCSHWIRPHWKTSSGTSWPYGYTNVGQGVSFASQPEFDWSLQWVRDRDAGLWRRVTGQATRRPLVHRIAIPARTSRHPQATVHTIWSPGSPNDPKNKLTVVYGFEKSRGVWTCFTSWVRPHK
jgi:hypothetical protein